VAPDRSARWDGPDRQADARMIRPALYDAEAMMGFPESGISRDPAEPAPGVGAGEARRPRGLEALADFCKDPSAEPDHPLVPGMVSF
jgi:hypothetical protein